VKRRIEKGRWNEGFCSVGGDLRGAFFGPGIEVCRTQDSVVLFNLNGSCAEGCLATVHLSRYLIAYPAKYLNLLAHEAFRSCTPAFAADLTVRQADLPCAFARTKSLAVKRSTENGGCDQQEGRNALSISIESEPPKSGRSGFRAKNLTCPRLCRTYCACGNCGRL
jgi:hypothetical protein